MIGCILYIFVSKVINTMECKNNKKRLACTRNSILPSSALHNGSKFLQSTFSLSQVEMSQAMSGNNLQLFVYVHKTKSFHSPPVKVQVRDLCYNSGNLDPNYIMRHMLTKWTDHPTGIYR